MKVEANAKMEMIPKYLEKAMGIQKKK